MVMPFTDLLQPALHRLISFVGVLCDMNIPPSTSQWPATSFQEIGIYGTTS